MVEHLAEVLEADCVYIGEFLGGHVERVKTLAACLDHRPDSFEYELAGSASAQAALGKPCICRAHAQKRFPADPMFPKWNAQACVGVPLLNSSGLALGILMSVYRKPIPDTDAPKAILEMFAPRAAAELERKQQEEQLRQSEERYRAFIALNANAMWRIEFEQPISTALPEQEQMERIYRDGYLAECNDALARQAGFERAEEVIGCRVARPGSAVESNRPQCNPPCHPFEVPVHHGGNVAGRPRRQDAGICCAASGALSKMECCGASGAATATSPS